MWLYPTWISPSGGAAANHARALSMKGLSNMASAVNSWSRSGLKRQPKMDTASTLCRHFIGAVAPGRQVRLRNRGLPQWRSTRHEMSLRGKDSDRRERRRHVRTGSALRSAVITETDDEAVFCEGEQVGDARSKVAKGRGSGGLGISVHQRRRCAIHGNIGILGVQ